jgi:hypothetical protein
MRYYKINYNIRQAPYPMAGDRVDMRLKGDEWLCVDYGVYYSFYYDVLRVDRVCCGGVSFNTYERTGRGPCVIRCPILLGAA